MQQLYRTSKQCKPFYPNQGHHQFPLSFMSLSQLTKANLYVGLGIPIYSFCFKRLFIRLSTAFIYSVVVT